MKHCGHCKGELKYYRFQQGYNAYCTNCSAVIFYDDKLSWFMRSLLRMHYRTSNKKEKRPALSVMVMELFNAV